MLDWPLGVSLVCDFFVVTLLVLLSKEEHPPSNSRRRDGPGSRAGTALHFFAVCTELYEVRTYVFFPRFELGIV